MTNEQKKFLDNVAYILNSLQVPVSMGMQIGVATRAFIEMREQLNLRGWVDIDDIRPAIEKLFDTKL